MPMSEYVRQLRAKVGHDVILSIGAAALVVDETGRYLLIRRSDNGLWGTPGGAVDPLEHPADAVVRETWEETGLLVEPTRLLAVFGGPECRFSYPSGDQVSPVTLVFACTIVGGRLQPDRVEAVDAAFFSPAEVLGQLPLGPQVRLNIESLLQIVEWPALPPVFAQPTWMPPADGVRKNGIPDYLRVLREKVGHDLLVTCGVSAVIFDDEGRTLMQKRGGTGEWGLVGGLIDSDESPADALVREVFEETGLLVEPVRITGVYGGPDYHGRCPNGDEVASASIAFECRVVGGELDPDGEESLDLAYWPVEKVTTGELIHWRFRMPVEHAVQIWSGEQVVKAYFNPASWQPPA